MPKHIHLSRIIATTITVLGCVSMTGCAAVSAVGAVASMAGSAMEAAGLKKPENAPIEVKLAIHSGENLNASSGQAMAVVTKIYYLKNPESFQRTPPAQLIDTAQEKAALGETMLAARELTLTPGQRYENVEKVPKEAEYIAVAGLFYAPAPMRWKYVFRVKDVEDSGIVLGAHACALSVTTGKPTLPAGVPPYDPSRLSGVQCPG